MKRLLVLCFTLMISICLQAARKALVIGNYTYGINYLASPGNDARLMTQTLSELGFDVTEKLDIDYDTFQSHLSAFTDSLGTADEAFFYFGGIALQMEGENYLLPVGFNYKSTNDIKYFSIPLRTVLDSLATAGTSMAFVDGGRDNTYILVSSGQIGLAEVTELPANQILQFSTAPGQWLESDLLPISNYAQALNTQLRMPARSMNLICSATADTISQMTSGTQQPWTAGSLPDYYYINTRAVDSPLAEAFKLDQHGNITFLDQPKGSGASIAPNGEPCPTAQIYYGDDAPMLHKSRMFWSIIDVCSASEFIMSRRLDSFSTAHLASWNLLRLNLAMFGAEVYYKKLRAYYYAPDEFSAGDHNTESDITQLGAGAGLQNPDRLRLFATFNTYKYRHLVPDWNTEEVISNYHNYSLSFAKRVRSNQQSLQIGAEYLHNSAGYPSQFMFRNVPLQPYSFDEQEYRYFPRWKARAYLYATDITTLAHESLHLAGVAPVDRPLLYARKDGVLLGISFDMEERSLETSSPSDYQAYKFSALLHKNFGRAVGFDFDFDYHDWQDLSDNGQQSYTQFRASMRLMLADVGPLGLSTAIDYVNSGYLSPDVLSQDDPQYDRHQGINGAAFLMIDIAKRLILSGVGQINTDWYPSDSFFKVEARDFFFGGTLGLRL